MRTRMPLVAGLLLTTVLAAGSVQGQITANPIPEPIVKKGLAVEVKDVVRLPQTRGLLPPPAVRGRTGYYNEEHVARIELTREMQADGLNLEAIRRVEEALGGNGRVLIRYSGTEPKARIMVEGEDELRVGEYARDLADQLRRAVGGV